MCSQKTLSDQVIDRSKRLFLSFHNVLHSILKVLMCYYNRKGQLFEEIFNDSQKDAEIVNQKGR